MERRTDRRRMALALGLGGLFLSVLLSLCLGAVPMGPVDLWHALTGEDDVYRRILLYFRLPRTLGAVLAGSGLAAAGTIVQSVLHNPMAGPNIIGINAGAGLAVTLCCALAPAAAGVVTAAAFLGALVSTLLIFALAKKTGASRITIVLAGIAVNYLLNAGTDTVVTLVPNALSGSTQFRLGSLNGVTFAQLCPAGVLILLSLAAAMLLAHDMDVLSLGEDTARSLGLAVGPIRFALLLLSSALAGAAVSFAGLLGFVGLLVPHAARFFVGEDAGRLLPLSALLGAAFLTFCDVLARIIFAPFELPVGIIMAFLGAPFFLWLLLHHRGGRDHA